MSRVERGSDDAGVDEGGRSPTVSLTSSLAGCIHCMTRRPRSSNHKRLITMVASRTPSSVLFPVACSDTNRMRRFTDPSTAHAKSKLAVCPLSADLYL